MISKGDRSGVVSLAEVRAQIPGVSGGAKVFQRGTLDLKLNVLAPPNEMARHAQDEIYVVLDGSGVFMHGDRRSSFETGDFLFVAAGVEHRFEEFTTLTLWRIYYGHTGGEVQA